MSNANKTIKQKTERINVRVSDETFEYISVLCEQRSTQSNQQTTSDVVRDIINEYRVRNPLQR